MPNLTPTQTKALEYIRTSIDRSGVAPTLREICSFMGYKAVGSAQDLINALRKKGYLEESEKQSHRTIMLARSARQSALTSELGDLNTYVIPCLGAVPAGNPVEAIEDHIGTLRMSISMLPKPYPNPAELFAVRARGDSMTGAGIFEGDWLVVKNQIEAPKESIVVARVESDVTVKRLGFDKKAGWFLQPENPRYEKIYASETSFEIVGRVLALQRALTV